MAVPRSHFYLVCGCPRSGTTWVHNMLISCGRFRGKKADAAGPVSRSFWATDENRYIHALLLRMGESRGVVARNASGLGLSLQRAVLEARYGDDGGVMLKSPYFCFFLDLIYRRGFASRFVFVRRNIESIAVSIVAHGNLGRQVSGDILSFSAMGPPRSDFESRWMPDAVKWEFARRYTSLSKFDRGLYKALCFITAFLALKQRIPSDAIFILDYDSIATDGKHRRQLCDFLELSDAQEQTLIQSYVPSRVQPNELPPHDAGFRKMVLETEALLWSGSC